MTLDDFSKIAQIIIALFTLIFSIYIFYVTRKNNKTDNRKESMRAIILNDNLKYFFLFFSNIIEITKPLNSGKKTDNEKEQINNKLQDSMKEVRLAFIDILSAVDSGLYKKILLNCDELIDDLTETMFDDGINLTNIPKFEKEITTRISISKTQATKTLYEYNC